MGEQAGIVARTILDILGKGKSGVSSSSNFGGSASRPLAPPVDFARLSKSLESTMKAPVLKDILSRIMCADPSRLFKRQESSYVMGMHAQTPLHLRSVDSLAHCFRSLYPDMHNILELIQRKTVESIIHNKYGADAVRIYRQLKTERKREQKNISDLAVISMSRTKELLWNMFRGGVLVRQVRAPICP